jgi:hypothetical protein
MEACYNVYIALMQSVTKIGTQGSMKNNGKTLQKLPAHITQEPTEGNRS